MNLFTKPPRLYFPHTDWKLFQKQMDDDIEQMMPTISNIGVDYHSFTTTVENALSISTPDKKPYWNSSRKSKINRSPCLWWNAECDKLIRLRKAALLKFRSSSTFYRI